MNPKHALLTLLVVVLSTFTAAGQGLYVESRTAADEKIEKFSYMPHMFRSTEDDGKITIIRLDKEAIYNIDPETKTYSELRFSEMKGMKDKVASMMKKRMEKMSPEQRQKMEELKKHMGNMSPEQKKAIEAMGGKKDPSDRNAYEVVNTGETKSISGFNCTKYIVKRHGDNTETVWATNDIRGTESLRKDMEQFMEKISMDLGSGKIGSEWYKEIRGFPIQTGSDGSTRTVTKIEQRSISSSAFEVPAGYTKEKMKGLEDLDQDKEN